MAEEKAKKEEEKRPSDEEILEMIEKGEITEKEADKKYGY